MIKSISGTTFSSVFKIISIAVSSGALALSVLNTYDEMVAFGKEI